jgi:hypothetical protein
MAQPPYSTERLRFFRSQNLDEREKGTMDHIEEFGWEVVMIDPDHANLGWAFTVGLHDVFGKPELIIIGLNKETAQWLLNDAAKRMLEGADLTQGRHKDLLEGVDVIFRAVDRKWLRQVMGWATWYNDGDEFPVLQAIFPDKQNRFPEEDNFDTKYTQPLLQPDAPMTVLEEDFWATSDPKSSLFDWKFPDSPHTGVYLSQTVETGEEAVTYVSHDLSDGASQFLGDRMADGGGPVISCFHHPIDRDPSLKELADLPPGWYAVRDTPTAPWQRFEHGPDEDHN